MKNKKTTISDIAKALNLSPSAVSKALNRHPRISKTTREAVERVAAELQYEPNHLAAALRKGKSYLIGIIVPAIDINFFASVVKGIETVINQQGYNAIITQSDDLAEKEIRSIDALLNTQVDGIICSLANATKKFDHLDKIINKGVPLVLFDRTPGREDISTVVNDDYQGAVNATEHLIREGCRNIVHLAGPKEILPYRLRAKGYQDMLKKHQIAVRPELIIESGLSQLDGIKSTKEALKRCPEIDAVFAASDYAALGAIRELLEQGIKVPEEVAVIGFSNEGFGPFVEPSLSTVDQHGTQMGEWAAKLLLQQCDSKGKKLTQEKIVLPTDLIIRASSRRKK
ncbi:MAG: LacI family transcriptional regulator [Saprospiraceae bacterium]|nr:LacI family transcriptional regulator [Saprospiraceae bacterium]